MPNPPPSPTPILQHNPTNPPTPPPRINQTNETINQQVAPRDVDFRIMLTFLEFYETLLRFALFKLYHSLELAYPP